MFGASFKNAQLRISKQQFFQKPQNKTERLT